MHNTNLLLVFFIGHVCVDKVSKLLEALCLLLYQPQFSGQPVQTDHGYCSLFSRVFTTKHLAFIISGRCDITPSLYTRNHLYNPSPWVIGSLTWAGRPSSTWASFHLRRLERSCTGVSTKLYWSMPKLTGQWLCRNISSTISKLSKTKYQSNV